MHGMFEFAVNNAARWREDQFQRIYFRIDYGAFLSYRKISDYENPERSVKEQISQVVY